MPANVDGSSAPVANWSFTGTPDPGTNRSSIICLMMLAWSRPVAPSQTVTGSPSPAGPPMLLYEL